MIDRYVFIRLVPDHAHPEARGTLLAALRAGLAPVPGLMRLTLGTPADESAAKWDLSLVARFATLGELDAALVSETWRSAFEHVLAHAVVVKSWSFEVAD